jgi:hypothetical protein
MYVFDKTKMKMSMKKTNKTKTKTTRNKKTHTTTAQANLFYCTILGFNWTAKPNGDTANVLV